MYASMCVYTSIICVCHVHLLSWCVYHLNTILYLSIFIATINYHLLWDHEGNCLERRFMDDEIMDARGQCLRGTIPFSWISPDDHSHLWPKLSVEKCGCASVVLPRILALAGLQKKCNKKTHPGARLSYVGIPCTSSFLEHCTMDIPRKRWPVDSMSLLLHLNC